VFDSVVAVAFQIVFRVEIHANNIFYFLKIIFDISTSKRSKKYKPHSILKKKKSKFDETQLQTQCQTHPLCVVASIYKAYNTWRPKKKLMHTRV